MLHVFWFLVAALALNGAFDGINMTAGLAVFADSIEDGERSYYFTQRTLSMTIGQIMGPLVGLVMFYAMGDQWTIEACAIVMCFAQVLLSPAFVLLWFFKDVEHSHEEEEEQVNRDEGGNSTPLLPCDETGGGEGLVEEAGIDPDVAVAMTTRCMASPRFIAICAATSDIISAFASGVSFRYFAIFFLKDLHFSPVLVQVLDALSCLVGSGLLLAAQRVSVRLGRAVTSVAFKTIGVVFLLSMVFSYKYVHHGGPPSESRVLTLSICLFYLLQGAFLFSTQALTRSLVMDNVPHNERAKWSALESINIFGWCGSAAVGGILVKMFNGNILPVFGLTAGLQVLGFLPLVVLFGIDTREGGEDSSQGRQVDNN